MAKTTKNNKNYSSKNDLDKIVLDNGLKPPQAVEIEKAVLGALMIEPNCVADVVELLTPECFYNESNKKIFTAIKSMASRHAAIDIYTVATLLEGKGELEEVGGESYLAELTLSVGAATNVDFHAKILIEKYIKREMITISYKMQKMAFDEEFSVEELLDNTQEMIFTLADKSAKRETQVIQDVISMALSDLEKMQDRADGLSGVPSGYIGIDKVTFGWQPADLIITAARPAMGKTAFVLTMARNMAVDHKVPVAIFSLEMPAGQLVKRLIVSETGIDNKKIRGGAKLTVDDWAQINSGLNELSQAPLYIDDTPSLSIYEFKSKARRLVQNSHVKLIIIDYLQLMTGPSDVKQMREQEVSAISRSLKSIAKELDIPIIALSQLSRAVEARGGTKRPQLSDLRESGAIEQDADIVMFIHRPGYYGLDDSVSQDAAEIIIAKHRNGEVKDVPMRFRSSEVKFVDVDDNDDIGFGDSSPENSYETLVSKMNDDVNNEFE